MENMNIKDNRSMKVVEICNYYINKGCRSDCPLSEACKSLAGDTKESFDIRMNKSAEEL